MTGEEDFDTSAKEFASSRVARAERLGTGSTATPVQSGWKYFCIVKDNEVVGPQELREIAEDKVLEIAALTVQAKHAGGGTIR